MAYLYHDTWITCTDDAIVIRWYYLWGPKRIPYAVIRSARRVDLGTFRGNLRIWGTANPRYWASLDPGRPRKSAALILDVGTAVRPFITPCLSTSDLATGAIAIAVKTAGGIQRSPGPAYPEWPASVHGCP